jgi:site-specific DNA-methyltransferase (adenine-specific)
VAHACVTDAPYHLSSIVNRFGSPTARPPRAGKDGTGSSGVFKRSARGFMGKLWDGGDIAFRPETWRLVYDVLPPGGHLLAFCGTRTYHRMACAVEDAGFSVRDCLAWLYGTGFPKSRDVGRAIKRETGKDAPAWAGWGTALKPALELIVMARKPVVHTVAANVLAHGTGALNVDACRVGERERPKITDPKRTKNTYGTIDSPGGKLLPDARWPANVVHDGSAEVESYFPDDGHARGNTSPTKREKSNGVTGWGVGKPGPVFAGDAGNASRFFFAAEPDPPERMRRELKRNPKPDRGDGYGMDKRAAPPSGLSFGDGGNAARFFQDAPFTLEDAAWCHGPVDYAVECSNLQSKRAVSVLGRAVAQSMPGSALQSESYRAPSISATASEFATLCESVTTAIQIIAQRFSCECPPQNITVNLGPARCAAIPGPTGIMTITASHWKSDGCAEPVTFNITLPNAVRGAAASRLFYSAKADANERLNSRHPTIKPVDLMRWLVRLVTPPKGLVLDPFAGSGTTGMACMAEGFDAVLIERESEYVADIRARLAHVRGDDTPLFAQGDMFGGGLRP